MLCYTISQSPKAVSSKLWTISPSLHFQGKSASHTKGLFSCENFLDFATVIFLFLFGKHYLIIK